VQNLDKPFGIDGEWRPRNENFEFFEQEFWGRRKRVHVDVRVQLAHQVQERIVETAEKRCQTLNPIGENGF